MTNEQMSQLDAKLNILIDKRDLANDHSIIYELFDKYKLSEYLFFFIKNATNKREDLYHNVSHCFTVALNCYEGAVVHHLNKDDTIALMLAGLYHDFNHSMGRFHKDKDNIALAVNGLKAANDSIDSKFKVSDAIIIKAVKSIVCTEYPYAKTPPNDLSCRIIRDADLMMMYQQPLSRLNSYVGIYYESTEPVVAEFCRKLKYFCSSVVWLTTWGRTKAVTKNYPVQVNDLIFQFKKKMEHRIE